MANSFQQAQQEALNLLSAIQKEIKEIDGDLTSTANKLSGIFKGVNSGDLKNVTDSIKKVNEGTNKMISLAEKQLSLEKKKQNEINKMWKQRESQIKKETDLQQKKAKDYIRAEQEVANARKKSLRDADKQRALEQKARESLQKQKTAALEYARAYNVLVRKQKEAKKVLQDMIVLHGKDAKATKQAQKEYDKLSKKVNQANKAASNFAKTGLGKTLSGFRNLVGAFGIVGGVTLFADFAKSTINVIKELDKLEFTLKSVSETEGDVARATEFLIDLSLRYGAEIISTTERYVKFSVAAKNAGLSALETEKIFGTVTKASAVLGLKTDELTGIYLALEQMLSKGKVTTEELRRQLGERLPGAFDLAAKAMGVTSSELDKMLKAGEVVASDMLPKLRVEIEKAFGLENLENVNTLQTATEKLTSSWKLFIGALNEGTGVGNKWQFIIERLAISFQNLGNAIQGVEMVSENKAFAEYYKELQDDGIVTFNDASESLKILNGLLQKQQEEYEDLFALGIPKPFTTDEDIELAESMIGSIKGRIKAMEAYMKLLDSQKESEKEQIQIMINRIELMKIDGKISEDRVALSELEKMNLKELKDLYNDLQKPQEGTVGWLKQQISANTKLIDLEKDRDSIMAIQEKNKALKEKLDLLLGVENSTKKTNKIESVIAVGFEESGKTETTHTAFKQLESVLKELIDLYGENTVMGQKLTKQLENLYKTTETLEDVNKEAREGMEKDLESRMKQVEATKKQAEEQEKLKEQAKDLMRTFSDDFFSMTGFEFLGEFVQDFDEISKMLDESEVQWAAWGTAIMEIAQEAFNFINQQQKAKFDAEYENLEREKEIAILFAGDSADAREEIDRQYEEKKRAIRVREAKAQKEMALFNAIIDTAQGIMSTIAQVGFPGAIPLVALIGAIGAAQIAMISSQPEPSFFRGTMNAPEGWANVDEKRPEVHTDRQGRIKSFGEGKANKRWLERGDRIYTSREEYFKKELGDVLQTNDIVPFNQMFDVPNIHIEQGMTANDLRREISSLKATIREVEPVNINLDKRGFQSSFGRKDILNNQLRIKRRRI